MSPEGGPPPAPVAFPDQEPMRNFVLSAPARPRGRKQTSMITTETLFMAHPTFIYFGFRIADLRWQIRNPQSNTVEQPLGVAYRLREPRERVIFIFFIFKSDQVLVLHLDERAQDRLDVEDAAPNFPGRVLGPNLSDVFQVQIVQPGMAFPNGLGRINLGSRRVSDIDAQANARVVAFH